MNPFILKTVNRKSRIPKIVEQYDTANRSFGTGWTNGMTWGSETFHSNTNILLNLSIPARNDSTSWGGLYTEVQYQLNNGTWVSLGNSGYDGVMGTTRLILTYNKSFLVFDSGSEPISDYSVTFRFKHRSYNGTTYINQSHAFSGKRFGTILRLTEVIK